jgi:hypothetical protein
MTASGELTKSEELDHGDNQITTRIIGAML